MDLFHIKIFKKQKTILSVVYSIQENMEKSHFVTVESCVKFLYRPGLDPYWMKNCFPIQDIDLDEARTYVFNQLKKDQITYQATIQVGWDWTTSNYQSDAFIDSVLALSMLDEVTYEE